MSLYIYKISICNSTDRVLFWKQKIFGDIETKKAEVFQGKMK